MNGYIAPSFPAYEFAPEGSGDSASRRWLAHWDGRVGAPAEAVVMAWSSGSASALVVTSGEVFGRAYARLRAAHLALGGTFLPAASRPVGPTDIVRAMEQLRDDDDAWGTIHELVPGATYAEAAEGYGCVVAYALVDGGAVLVAATGVSREYIRVRVRNGLPTI